MYFLQLPLPLSSLPMPFTAYIGVQQAPISFTQLELRRSHYRQLRNVEPLSGNATF